VLWWFIGAWLGSAAIVPILWLLSVVHPGIFSPGIEARQKQIVPEAPRPVSWRFSSLRIGRYALSGLLAIAGLVLVFMGSSSDPLVTIRGLVPSRAGAQATSPQMASAEPPHSPTTAPLSPEQPPVEPAQAEATSRRHEALPEPPLRSQVEHAASSVAQSGSLGESAEDHADPQKDAPAVQIPVIEVPPAAPMHRTERLWEQWRRGRAAVFPPNTQPSRGTWLWPVNQFAGG
jgi:hypothetical protein